MEHPLDPPVFVCEKNIEKSTSIRVAKALQMSIASFRWEMKYMSRRAQVVVIENYTVHRTGESSC